MANCVMEMFLGINTAALTHWYIAIGCFFAVVKSCNTVLALMGYHWVIPKGKMAKFLGAMEQYKKERAGGSPSVFIAVIVILSLSALEVFIWPYSVYKKLTSK